MNLKRSLTLTLFLFSIITPTPSSAFLLRDAPMHLSCEDLDNCPEYAIAVASAESMDSEPLGVCSGSLIRGGYAILNAHCLPSQLQNLSEPRDCSQNIKVFHYKKTQRRTEEIPCRRVLYSTASSEREDGVFRIPDVAILELGGGEFPDAPQIGRAGLEVGHSYQMVSTVTYRGARQHQDPSYRKIISRTCGVASRSVILTRSMESHDPVVAIAGCEVVSGQSGSALLDSQGMVQGVFFAHMGVRREFPHPRDMDDLEIPFSLATNLACVLPENSSYAPGTQPTQCVKYEGLTEQERMREEQVAFKVLMNERVHQAIQPRWQRLSQSFRNNSKFIFYPEIAVSHTPSGDVRLFEFQAFAAPKCIKPRLVAQLNRNLSITQTLRIPVWNFMADIDSNAQLSYYFDHEQQQDFAITIQKENDTYHLRMQSSGHAIERTIDVCPNSRPRVSR